MAVEPVVDGIAREVGSVAKVVRVELPTEFGRAVAARYGVELTPTFLVFDREGRLVRTTTLVDAAGVVRELRALASP